MAHAVGMQMLVFGGIAEDGNIIDDVSVLDMTTFRWMKVYTKGSKPAPMAFMSSVLIIQPERRMADENFQIYKLPEVSTKTSFKKLKLEGLYVFGGLTKDSKALDELRVLRLGKKPLDWVKPACHGKRPSPRYSCTLNYYEDLSLLILHGGRNSVSEDSVFSDTFVLDLYSFVWIEVNIYDYIPFPRSEHSSAIANNKLIILGGTDTLNFLAMDLYVISLNFYEKKRSSVIPPRLKLPSVKDGSNSLSPNGKVLKKNNINSIFNFTKPSQVSSLGSPNTEREKNKSSSKNLPSVPKGSSKYLKYIQRLKETLKKDIMNQMELKNKKQMEEEIEKTFGK